MKVLARLVFGLAAAVTSAAAIDPLVEALSNRGTFGTGRFTDGSTADVIPAFAVGAALCALVVAISIIRFMRADGSAPRWFCAAAEFVNSTNALRALPIIFLTQLACLYTMETFEQTLVVRHLYGGAVWLGAPMPFALILHAVGCVGITWMLAGMLRACAQRLAIIVHRVLRYVRVRRTSTRLQYYRRELRERTALRLILSVSLPERAPPLAI